MIGCRRNQCGKHAAPYCLFELVLFFFYESVCLGTFESEAELGIAIVQINSDKKRWKTDVLPPA